MHPPPDHSITVKLEGCVIDVIMVMRYQISFVCEERNGFCVSSPFCFGRNDQIEHMPWMEFPLSHIEIPRVLGSTIVSAKTDEEKSLRIEFSTGDTILASWIPNYESYELQIDGDRIIV